MEDAKRKNTVVLMMHGYGGNSGEFLDICDTLEDESGAHVIPLLAPFVYDESSSGGRKWFTFYNDDGYDSDELDFSLSFIKTMIAVYGPENVILCGFSQGGMMAIHAGLLEGVKAVVSISGFIVEEIAAKNTNTEFMLIHGTEDEVISCEVADEIKNYIDSQSCLVTLKKAKGCGHSINDEILDVMLDFIIKKA